MLFNCFKYFIALNTIAALKDGDQLVFDQVFYQYHGNVYAYVLNKTNSVYLAEETTQLTFIKLWQSRKNLNEELSLFTQLFRIARTTMIDLIRKQNNNQLHTSQLTVVNERNDVWEKVSERELHERMHASLNDMPDVRRKVFEMSRVKGMSYKAIANELSISVKTVESHIYQAIKQLKHLITILLPIFFIFS